MTPKAAVAAKVEPKKSGGNWWKWVLGIPVVLFILFVAIGLAGGWDSGGYNSKSAAIDSECEKMMSDSAPGNERRMTRQICDQMKEIARIEKNTRK